MYKFVINITENREATQINTRKSLFKPLRYYKFDLNKYVYYKILILGSIVTFEFTLKLLIVDGLVQVD